MAFKVAQNTISVAKLLSCFFECMFYRNLLLKKEFFACLGTVTPVRKEAIEIANALLRDGMEDGRAIAIATEKAREYVGGDVKQEIYKVLKHSDGWQLQKDSGTKAISVVATKQELLDKAKLCE